MKRITTQMAKQIVAEMPNSTVREQAEALYNSALSSPSLRDCVKLIAKIRRELK